MSDSFLLSFNFQCSEGILDVASQHESPTYNCSYFKLVFKLVCPYIGRQLLQKVSVDKSINTGFYHDDDDDDLIAMVIIAGS